ncbi:hypothetical protein [Chryseobacterium sp.]|uniref:hypothetical protein n=1 Tax=Chryseobacterium sp. TaxID=1871047 RepID=UPI0025BE7B2E|nr:hypothetical protein [Chryseobacterium sp.]
MKKILNLFALLPFLLIPYFIFIHPAIIYYNTVHYSSLPFKDGKVALVYLGLSFILWAFSFGYSFYLMYRSGFMTKRNINYIMNHGTRISAVIKEIKNQKMIRNFEFKELILELDNLSHETILYTMPVNDSKPQEKRFTAGKIIYLRVDPEFKKRPYVTLENIQSKINFLLYIVWGLLLVGVIYYYFYSYIHENYGYGWRFLALDHPLILSPIIFLFFGIIYIFIQRLFNKLSPKDHIKLQFKGIRATAKINDASQTGTYINKQPQVKFIIEFTDRQGKLHQTSIKKIVSLMDIGQINQLKERDILYLPDNPEVFDFLDEKK